MKEQIYTIPVNEVYDTDCECPLCELEKKLEKETLDYALGAAMMEPEFRMESNEKGFCNHHYSMLFGMSNFAYATSWQATLMILFFDYLIAFGVIGLGGVFRGIKNQAVGLALGALLASVLRFLCHFLSGITVWAGFADGMPVWLYSLIYNGLYMLPEFGILIAGAIILGLLIDFRSEKLGAIKRNKK